MKSTLEKILQFLARRVIRKYQPRIVGITGSVGKTSTKEAVFAVLSEKFRARRSLKNYNNEIGVPLTILGAESGNKSLLKWIGVFLTGLHLLIFRDKEYPEILILEMGADKPGDIERLTQLAPCSVGILTAISPAHLELFESYEQLKKEKRIILSHLKSDGTAIMNIDSPDVAEFEEKIKCRKITYSIKNDRAELRAVEIRSKIPDGIQCKLSYKGSVVPLLIPEVLGSGHVLAALSAASVGILFGMNLLEITQALRKYSPQPGRMRILSGIKRTTIIDDSYNSSPLPLKDALEVLSNIELPEVSNHQPERIAVLGDMNELGAISEEEHRKAGELAAQLKIGQLITVGEKAKDIAKAARKSGMEEGRIFLFSRAEEAGKFVQERMEQGDVILIKGSQNNVRLEKLVKEIMAEPLRAQELLVRQGPEWERK